MKQQTNFGDLPQKYCAYDKAKIVVLPAPFDATSTWIKGADKGPAAIIDASANMETYDIETDSEVYKQGIFTDKPIKEKKSPQIMVAELKARTLKHIKNKKYVVTLGGEHSVSTATIQAHVESFKNVSVLQFDAHADLREEYHGTKYNHACVMARARENAAIVQVGIRSAAIEESKLVKKDNVFLAQDIYDNNKWFDKCLKKLTKNVYLTIDLDAFDPAILPSTGTPEPGGLGWYQTLVFLKKLMKQKNVVGFDIVELCPNPKNKASDFLAAKLVYKLLSYRFCLK
ncbi:MAG: agmatinase [Planctomycetes bacterium]|nr:agmatinase [Planctomycetota bacterium]MBU1518775.1 agmatinase [Planctomycetota bacterium]MBU2457590.1 agmatinase [Planctomycetota bacterium]MBU2596029.1 agmatinase [Planctomycetota bacterium]